MSSHLNYEPSQLLGQETWSVLLEAEEVYTKELELCLGEISKVEWLSDTLSSAAAKISCPECHSELIKPIITKTKNSRLISYNCCSCGEVYEYENIVEHILSEYFEWENYLAAKDGGDYLLVDCFECGSGAFVVDEGMCMVCEAEIQYTECAVCRASLSVEEQDLGGLCGYHHHTLNKDD